MIENLIFDWSGTLAVDLPLTLVATNATLEAFGGAPVDLATYRRDFKIPVMEFYGPRVTHGDLEAIDGHFFAAYRLGLEQVALYEGAEALLRTLSMRGLRIDILSTVPTELIEASLEQKGLRQLFTRIEGGASDKRSVLSRMLKEEGLLPDRTLFVGDTAHDLETGRLAGTRNGASLYGYGMKDALLALEPDHAFESLADLGSLIDRHHLMDRVPLVIPTVGGILRDPCGRVLVVQTTKWSGTYGIPGGKIDYGETMVDAYRREILEETGLEVLSVDYLMTQDCIENPEFVKKRHFLLINYISDIENPERLRTNYEIVDAKWVTLKEARAMNLNEPTRLAFDEAERLGFLSEERAH